METIKINPEECEIFGNIISNKHGYLKIKTILNHINVWFH